MKQHKTVKFEFSLSGLLIGLVVVSMFASVFGVMMGEINLNYNNEGNFSLAEYDQIDQITADAENIQDSTDITQETGLLDVIGGYFSSGYSALKVTFNSYALFGNMLDDASGDISGFSLLQPYIFTIILLAVLIGIILTVLLKTRL